MRLETQSGQPWPVDDGGKAAYSWVDADANHIYALYSGTMRSEENALYTNKVHLFNWDLARIIHQEILSGARRREKSDGRVHDVH